jgi:hypothetical protein
MAGLLDNTLDELDSHLRELKRQVSRLEALRRQLEVEGDEKSEAANERARSSSLVPPSA